MYCNRCKNKNRLYFRKINCQCSKKCYYCLKCAHISIFKTCEKLDNNLIFTRNKIDLVIPYELTSKQMKISDYVLSNIVSSNVYINAVCGAGKTEIILKTLVSYVNNEKNVCFVCPRKEVIHELYHRFRSILKIDIGIITGKDKIYSGTFFCMTNHQLINYHNLFDLVIVDEVDAFPLYNDLVLENGIYNSLKNTGKVIMMSATPKVIKGFKTVALNERYHKQKIPIPTFCIQNIEEIDKFISSKKWIVFFPTIKMLEEYLTKFSIDIVIAHSKVNSILEQIPQSKENFVIFSTAILERGITIPNVNIIVVNANHQNYNKSTLIQIAGRVGRVMPYTTGEVIFMDTKNSFKIKRVIKYLSGINE